MIKLPPPSEVCLRLPIRKILGSRSVEPVKVGLFFVKIRGYLLSYHDLYHLEVSCLERILMGKHMVSGIHGINSLVLHKDVIVEEYDALLDEARVALHEWLTHTSIFNTIKAIFWILWLITKRINPIAVIIRHLKVMRRPEPFNTWLENITFVCTPENQLQTADLIASRSTSN